MLAYTHIYILIYTYARTLNTYISTYEHISCGGDNEAGSATANGDYKNLELVTWIAKKLVQEF